MRSVLALPSVWVALSLGLLVVTPPESAASGSASPSDLAVIVAGVLAGRVVLQSRQLGMVRSVPAVGFLAIGTMALIAAVVAHNYPDDLIGGVRFVELFLLTPLAVMVALRTRTDALVVVGSLLALSLVEGAIGLFQYASGTGAGIGGASVRAVGTFGAYNIGTLADITAAGFVVCLSAAIVQRGRLRWWATAGAAFLLLADLATLARGAWVAVAVAAVVVISRGRPARLLGTVAAIGLAAGLLLPPLITSGSLIGQRVESLVTAGSTPDQSLVDRRALWRAAMGMAVDNPLSGVGPRAFPNHRDAYADFTLLGSSDISFGDSFQQVELKSPHSMYLLVAGEQGLIAAWVFCVVLLTLLGRSLVHVARHRSDASTTVALIGVGLLSYELVAMVTSDLGGPGSLLIGIFLGLAGWAAADVPLLAAGR